MTVSMTTAGCLRAILSKAQASMESGLARIPALLLQDAPETMRMSSKISAGFSGFTRCLDARQVRSSQMCDSKSA